MMEWKYGPAAQSINQTQSFLFIQPSIKLNFFNLNWIGWWRKDELIVDELLAAPQFVSRIELPRWMNKSINFTSFNYWFLQSTHFCLAPQEWNHSMELLLLFVFLSRSVAAAAATNPLNQQNNTTPSHSFIPLGPAARHFFSFLNQSSH